MQDVKIEVLIRVTGRDEKGASPYLPLVLAEERRESAGQFDASTTSYRLGLLVSGALEEALKSAFFDLDDEGAAI